MTPFDAANSDRNAAARASGLPVIGYLSTTAPVEMIRAAGAFAQQVTGSPDDDTPDALHHMEPFFDGWILSVFQQLLDGRLDHLSALVIPRTSEVMLQLYYHMLEVMRRDPGLKLPTPILFDLLQTPFDATARYNAGRLVALRDRLGGITGQQITDDTLTEAIATEDTARAHLARINTLRVDATPTLTGAEMQRIIMAATVMAPADFSTAAGALTQGSGPRKGARLMLTGSGHDTDGFHRAVEATGATITADDHPHGDWRFLDPVGGGDPMQALLTKYHLNAPSTRTYPREKQDARVLEAALRGRADACIFFTEEHDDALGFDYPTQRDLLAEQGIPTLFLNNQPYRAPDRAAQQAAIDAFLSTLPQGVPA